MSSNGETCRKRTEILADLREESYGRGSALRDRLVQQSEACLY
jgi:hypothetical protein